MKNKTTTEKDTLHPRNPHRFRYNFEKLIASLPDLKQYVFINDHGIETIDFANPDAVKSLNKAILTADYDILNWDIPSRITCSSVTPLLSGATPSPVVPARLCTRAQLPASRQ